MRVINPQIALKIYGAEEITITDAHISFEIIKDLEDEPNEANLTIYNLNEDTRNNTINPDLQDVPIEIYLTEHGKEEFILAFRGEIDTVRNVNMRPGYSTQLKCLSQKVNHQNKFIDAKTYAKGTPYNQIVQDFIDIIELPYKTVQIPTTGILLSQSFSGQAYKLLQKFVFDIGYFVYILDGVLYISSIYEPVDTSSFEIRLDRLLSEPTPTERVDARDLEARTVTENTGIDPFQKVKKRKKKTKSTKGIVSRKPYIDQNRVKQQKTLLEKQQQIDALGQNDYVEYEATDMVVTGKDFEILLVPSLSPDQIINVEGNSKLYRIREVVLQGDNFGGEYMAILKTDDYEGEF